MKPLDWFVLSAWLVFLVGYGLYRGRGSNSVSRYLLAGRSMPWYAMGLSILATQASAITFISTTGQGYIDGLRFVQFYFGLPLAMIAISAVVVPIFRRSNVYTAYEYLEGRFDAKTRALVSILFLVQRGLGAGIGLYAPAVTLASVLGWSDRWTTVLIGVLVIAYTATGGIKALTWADVLQMSMIFLALLISLFVAIHSLPASVSFGNALHLAGAVRRMNIVDLHLNWSSRYNLWSGLLGGGFLALAYFGCDQSQVQRYLTGQSITQSRLSLLFNAVVKIPMQLFILFIGAMVFVLFLFSRPPMIFESQQLTKAEKVPGFAAVEQNYQRAFEQRRRAASEFLASSQSHGTSADFASSRLRQAEEVFESARRDALRLIAVTSGGSRFDDTNYIFLSFVTHFLPVGLVGLVVGVIFSASMGSTSGEINSLATVSVIDLYRRFLVREKSDRHYLLASRLLTVFWGTFAISFAAIGARGFGALIERVNIVGSLFYGGLLGVFLLAFLFKKVQGTAAFWGVIAGETTILCVAGLTPLSFLWYNVVGATVVVIVALGISAVSSRVPDPRPAA